MIRRRARITGRVQGVSFRYYTHRTAERLGVTGWVRNEPDGSVLLEAQGAEPAVEGLLAWCREGPPAASVRTVGVDDIDVIEGETGFGITG